MSVNNPEEEKVAAWLAEQQWHLENATTDMTLMMQGLQEGESVEDVSVFSCEGAPLDISSMWAEKPLLLLTGSMTCPPSRQINPVANELQSRYPDISVAVLYVIDAHPDGDPCPYTGTDWLTHDNAEADIHFGQPKTQDDRNTMACAYRDLLGLAVPVLADNMQNQLWQALGRTPNAAFLIDTKGTCGLCQVWARPDELFEELDSLQA